MRLGRHAARLLKLACCQAAYVVHVSSRASRCRPGERGRAWTDLRGGALTLVQVTDQIGCHLCWPPVGTFSARLALAARYSVAQPTIQDSKQGLAATACRVVGSVNAANSYMPSSIFVNTLRTACGQQQNLQGRCQCWGAARAMPARALPARASHREAGWAYGSSAPAGGTPGGPERVAGVAPDRGQAPPCVCTKAGCVCANRRRMRSARHVGRTGVCRLRGTETAACAVELQDPVATRYCSAQGINCRTACSRSLGRWTAF